jgi:hypothetical protein
MIISAVQCSAVQWEPRGQKRDKGRRGTELGVERYYFYLAFENSLCKDYITEKFFDAMSRDVVPVVRGGGDYAKVGLC